MNTLPIPAASISPLPQRLMDDMSMRRFTVETQRNYLRDVARLASFLGRPPDTTTPDDLRCFQVAQQEAGLGVPTMNAIVSALRWARPISTRQLHRVVMEAPVTPGTLPPCPCCRGHEHRRHLLALAAAARTAAALLAQPRVSS